MTTTLSVQSASTADESAGSFDAEVEKLITHLVSLWNPHHQKGMKVRHDTGRLLNELLGSPRERQQYGQGTCKKVALRIGVSRSDVSRMRRFADAHPDFEEFQRQHPDCTTWTSVKEHLGTSRNEAPSDSGGVTKRLCRSLRGVTKKVREDARLSSEDHGRLLKELEKLAKALGDAFGIRLRIEQEPRVETEIVRN